MSSQWIRHGAVLLSGVGGACAAFALLGAMTAPTLSIAVQAPLRAGLWETSYVNPQIERQRLRFLAKSNDLPPDQRELMMKNVPGGDGGTKRVCLSADSAMKIPIYEQRVKGCSAKTKWAGRKSVTEFNCDTGASGHAEIDYPNDRSYKGFMVMHDTMQSGRGSNRAELSGRWLQADCGDVAPAKPIVAPVDASAR